MIPVTLAAAAVTFTLLWLLAWRDPSHLKPGRRDATEGGAAPWSTGQRRLLAIVAAAPGIALAVGGAWAQFAMWLGLVSLLGWLTARVLPRGG